MYFIYRMWDNYLENCQSKHYIFTLVITDAEEKLHPSWEAKRKRKEQESKITEFQGKKMKFDD